MKKRSALLCTLTIALALGGTIASPIASTIHAASAKQSLTFVGGGSYYGQVENGKAHGKGTVKWPNGKTYSGSFVNGLRSGTGKYINEYSDSDYRYKVVYNGSWNNDRMNGDGTLTEQRFLEKDHMVSNQIQTGTFKNNALLSGYSVTRAEADPEYSFTYQTNNMTLNVLENQGNLLPLWKKGSLFSVTYKKGTTSHSYSLFPEESAKKERERQASIKYLKSITTQVTPHLQKFEQLSKQLSLK